jgi:hypothetical protein
MFRKEEAEAYFNEGLAAGIVQAIVPESMYNGNCNLKKPF